MMTKRHWLDARSCSPRDGASRPTGRLSLALLMAVSAAGLTLAAPPSRPHRTIADPRASDAVRFPAAQEPPAAGTIGDPGPSAITSFPLPVDRGRIWLEAHQAANGSWGATYQFVDTATAVETLGTLDPCYASVTRGADWLAAQPPSNYEYLARQVRALSYPPSFYEQSRALALELLAAREPAETDASLPNWPAGGWGVAAGYETDVFTTAVALLALERTGFGGGLRANSTALAGGATNVHVWTIPPDALKARIEITVSGSTVRLRMTQGRQPNPFDPYFSLAPGGPYLIVFPDSGLPLTPGVNYIAVESPSPPAAPATYTMLGSYDTPDFDTHAIDEALSYLRASQNVNGGWGLQRGQATDFFTSLHALLAIERYPQYDFDTEITSGVSYVKTQQLGDGSFGYGGVAVPYVTALASLALVRGETYPFSTATERAVTALRAQQLADGSWSGEPYDTALAMLASWDHDRPPKVNADSDQNAVDADGNCVQTFTLAGSATSYNGSITSYAWSDNCLAVATGAAPIVTLPVGVHRLVLAATDSLGLVARDTAVVTVTESAQTTCGDSDLDGILDDGDGNGVLGDHLCRDGFAYGCDDNCPTTTNPNQSNVDRDEAGDACDCAASSATVWSLPGQVTLTLSHVHTTGVTTIGWGAPANRGGTQALVYDSLRSTSPSDFTNAATCLESNGTDTQSTDNAAPAAGSARHYLVRAENDCPARGSLGTGSNGVERPGRACP